MKAGRMCIQLLLFLVSFACVACAQPDWSTLGCALASACGYTLFWMVASTCHSQKIRLILALVWFGGVSALHLNWFFADRYVGIYIYPFLVLLLLLLGLQFAIITLLTSDPKKLSIVQMLGISGLWAVLEWSRLFLLSGYSLDPVGLALSATTAGMQMVALFGVYGLSFWVIFTNLVGLRALSSRSWGYGSAWVVVGLVPYLFGWCHLSLHKEIAQSPTMHALLVQTALLPEEKLPVNGSTPLRPTEQWQRMLAMLTPYLDHPIDLIVLPEGVVPYGTHYPIYHAGEVGRVFHEMFGEEHPFKSPSSERVGNYFWAQKLANFTHAPVILGLEDVDVQKAEGTFQVYNAAFLINPYGQEVSRYEKRVLVPMGEYIPFKWCKKILSQYGILDSYTPGHAAKMFKTAQTALGISICYEETYGYLIRQSRQKGAEVLVNLTNDVWYPRSRLPMIHFLHGRLRAVEAGVPVLRACNTGVTCAVDALGRVVAELPCENGHTVAPAAVLSAQLPLYHYQTLYTKCGDALFLSCSAFFITFSYVVKRKQFITNKLNIYLLRKN